MKGARINIKVENISNCIRFYDELPDNIKAKTNSTKPMPEGPRIDFSAHYYGVTASVKRLSRTEDSDPPEPHQKRKEAVDMNVLYKGEALCSHTISILKSSLFAAMKNTVGNIGAPN
jgi:hypothetical protein